MTLAHETAHVRRRDPQWSFVADLLCAALWFAPPVWLCARAMRLESEAACDADALRETGAAKTTYARLLLAHAGPAPANALGGPARRLARRILMLDRTPQPLPRPLAGTLLAVALFALLPWRAVAGETVPTGPLQGEARWEPAVRVDLDVAAKVMLGEPGVRARVHWTAAQDAAVKAANLRWQKVWNVFAAELYQNQKTMTLREAFAWDNRERGKAYARAAMAAEPYPWTPEQERTLKALALGRFGSAVWKDPQVANRLRLTPKQVEAITRENRALNQDYQGWDRLGRLARPVPPMPKAVAARLKALNAAYLDAPVSRRQALNLEIARLRRPYEPVYRNTQRSMVRAEEERRIALSWRRRDEATARLTQILSTSQRETLRKLATDPAAWEG